MERLVDRIRDGMRDRLRGFGKRLRALFRHAEVERETQAELCFHIAMETQNNIAAGMSPADARTAAMRSFGGVDRTLESVRDVRRFPWLDDLRQDARHAARTFSRSPGFAAAAVLTIALGSGANIAVFSIVNAVLLTPLPYSDPDRLVRMWEGNPAANIDHGPVSPGTFSDTRARSRTLEQIALFYEQDYLLAFGETSEELHGASVSPALFELLGVQPVIGRTLSPEGVDAEREVVIGFETWQRKFGGSRDVIGKTIRLEARTPLTIVGVMPATFAFPARAQVWTRETFAGPIAKVQRQFRYYGAVAKLADGVTLEQARAETARIASDLEREYPASNAGWRVQMDALSDSITGDTRPTLLALMGLVLCLLLIACSNVANLIVARTTARAQEVAVRSSMGAGSARLVRQWITEGFVLALAGCTLGFLTACTAVHLLTRQAALSIPRIDELRFGAPVLLMAACITLFTAAFSGAAPAFHFRRLDASMLIRSGTRATGRNGIQLREWLNAAEVALTLVLLVSAMLLMTSFVRLTDIDLGFSSKNIATAELRIPRGRFDDPRPWARYVQHYDALFQHLRTPETPLVAGVTEVPLSGESLQGSLWRTDAPGASGRKPPTSAADQWKAAMLIVTPAYFDAMKTPVLQGRSFNDADRFTAEELTGNTGALPEGAAIINQAAARKFWPGEDAIGRRIFLFDDQTYASARVVVGVTADVRADAVAAAASPAVFLPFAQHPVSRLSVVVQSSMDAARLERALTERIHQFDPQISVSRVAPLDRIVEGAVSQPRFNMLMVASFAAIALALSAIGVFGVAAYIVTLRTPEIGIRIALGARRTEVLGLIFRSGFVSVLVGGFAGTVLAVIAAIGIRALLFGVEPLHLPSFAAALIVLSATCALAVVGPAYRAGRLKPIDALSRAS